MLARAAGEGTAVIEAWELPKAPLGAAVGFDNAAAGRAVAARFAAAGRRHLAFVGGDDPRAAQRFRGFAAGARAAGLAAPARLVLPAPAVMDDAAARASDPELAGADAVFTATDVHAVALLAALQAAGRRVPEDVALVGLGDLEIARHARPALSTVRIDAAAIGREAAGLVLQGQAAAGNRIDVGFALVTRATG